LKEGRAGASAARALTNGSRTPRNRAGIRRDISMIDR
jgi:hypothetical protein